MKRATLTIALALLLLMAAGSTAWADIGHGSFDTLNQVDRSTPTMTLTTTDVTPSAVTAENTDKTGYPCINAWKGGLDRDVHVFLNDSERHDLTQARVDETVAMQPIINKQASQLMSILTPDQCFIFRDIVARADIEKLAAMSEDDWAANRAQLSQQLNLTGDQEASLKTINNQLIADLAPVRAQYAGRFDTVIAAAEQRVANRGSISTENK